MRIHQAAPDDAPTLARLLWDDSAEEERAKASVDEFAVDLARWWGAHDESHRAFVARASQTEVVGMAWVALLPRVPRPGNVDRLSADIQSVYVMPEYRGQGIGSALVDAAAAHATGLGALRVTVHSGRRAVPVYQRLGFSASRQLMARTAPSQP